MKPGDYVVPSKDANNLGKCPLYSILLTKIIHIVEYDMMNNPGLFAYTRKAKYDGAQNSKMLTRAGENSMCLGSTTKHW